MTNPTIVRADMTDRQRFEAAILNDQEAELPHKAFSDWLDENGFPDEATYHRNWTIQVAAEEWLRAFADQVDADYHEMMAVAATHCMGSSESWPDYLNDGGKWEKQDTPYEFWKWFTILTAKVPDNKYGMPGIFSCSC